MEHGLADVGRPQGGEQLLLRHDPIVALDQVCERVEHLRLERHLGITPPQLVQGDVEAVLAEGEPHGPQLWHTITADSSSCRAGRVQRLAYRAQLTARVGLPANPDRCGSCLCRRMPGQGRRVDRRGAGHQSERGVEHRIRRQVAGAGGQRVAMVGVGDDRAAAADDLVAGRVPADVVDKAAAGEVAVAMDRRGMRVVAVGVGDEGVVADLHVGDVEVHVNRRCCRRRAADLRVAVEEIVRDQPVTGAADDDDGAGGIGQPARHVVAKDVADDLEARRRQQPQRRRCILTVDRLIVGGEHRVAQRKIVTQVGVDLRPRRSVRC